LYRQKVLRPIDTDRRNVCALAH